MNHATAAAAADRTRERFPTSAEPWLLAGLARARLGEAEAAVPLLEKAVASGGAPEARLELARVLATLGRAAEALAALDGTPVPGPEERLIRADLLNGIGRLEEALEACDSALAAAGVARDVAHHRKARILLDAGRPKDALAALDAAIGVNPEEEEYWCDAAVAWRALGRETRAQRMLDGALRINPSSTRARALRAVVPASP